jgi:hypothetical protein
VAHPATGPLSKLKFREVRYDPLASSQAHTSVLRPGGTLGSLSNGLCPDLALQKALIFRNMLPTNGFSQTAQTANQYCVSGDVTADAQCTQTYMGDYYPVAVYCAKSVYDQGGWKACFPQQQAKQP